MGMSGKRIIVAATGASGCIYLLRTLRALLLDDHRVDFVVSKYGVVTLKLETSFGGFDGSFPEFLESLYPEIRGKGEVVVHNHSNQAASIASGSVVVDGMIVVPCTMKTLAGISSGQSGNLVERAADVVLKERRPLIVVPREAPYSLIHLRNMVALTEAGASVLPASPAFYQGPRSFDDLGDYIAGRALSLCGIHSSVVREWPGAGEEK
jgi:flavin prenyltransferase